MLPCTIETVDDDQTIDKGSSSDGAAGDIITVFTIVYKIGILSDAILGIQFSWLMYSSPKPKNL